jgi:hypothetical protein
MPFTWELSPTCKTEHILPAAKLWRQKYRETQKLP